MKHYVAVEFSTLGVQNVVWYETEIQCTSAIGNMKRSREMQGLHPISYEMRIVTIEIIPQ